MSCSAALCRCGRCGTHGNGSVEKALTRVRAKEELERQRQTQRALVRDLVKPVEATR